MGNEPKLHSLIPLGDFKAVLGIDDQGTLFQPPSLAAFCLITCERSEKERIIRLDAYSLTITLNVPEYPEGERNCYAYASAAATALKENPTPGGVADRAELTEKKYTPPKQSGTGGDWAVILTLRITVEGC